MTMSRSCDSNQVSQTSVLMLEEIIMQHNLKMEEKSKLNIFEHLTGRLVDLSIYLGSKYHWSIPVQLKACRSSTVLPGFRIHKKDYAGLALILVCIHCGPNDPLVTNEFDIWYIPSYSQSKLKLNVEKLLLSNKELDSFSVNPKERLCEILISEFNTEKFPQQPKYHLAFLDALLMGGVSTNHYIEHFRLHKLISANENILKIIPATCFLQFDHFIAVQSDNPKYVRAQFKSSLSGIIPMSHNRRMKDGNLVYRHYTATDFDVLIIQNANDLNEVIVMPSYWLKENHILFHSEENKAQWINSAKLPNKFNLNVKDANFASKFTAIIDIIPGVTKEYFESNRLLGSEIRLLENYQSESIKWAFMDAKSIFDQFKFAASLCYDTNETFKPSQKFTGKYKCPGCNYVFADKYICNRHIKGRKGRNQQPCSKAFTLPLFKRIPLEFSETN